MNKDWKGWTGLAARLVVGGLLTVTGFEKLSAPLQEFAALMDAYQLTPPTVNHWLAGVFAWAQLVLGLSLLSGYLTKITAGVTLALFSAFITALLSVVLRRIPLTDCGCYGEWIHLAPWQSVLVDCVLVGLTALILRHGGRCLSLDNWINKSQP